MALRRAALAEVGLDEASLDLAIAEHQSTVLSRLDRWWMYYRNPMRAVSLGRAAAGAWYRLAQEVGLPARLTGRTADLNDDDRAALRREVVIENDIAWRIHAMVDFLFAKPVRLVSTARDPRLAATIERTLDAVWEASGGIALLQDLALLGHVFGHADLLVRAPGTPTRTPLARADEPAFDPRPAARAVRLEVVEPRRGIAILDPADYRTIRAYAIHVDRALDRSDPDEAPPHHSHTITEVFTPAGRLLYHGDALIERRREDAFDGLLPVVHIQNIAQPFAYGGLGEVEPLIPMQDELNTRLSDRASRVTMQCFKMYLARGIDTFDQRPVGPGQVWVTNVPEAQITEFGGDADSPSEEAHIREVREALDKISAVPPLASGVVRAKIGNLTSANALRITLMGLLAKTMRKRVTYGGGIARASTLALTALDHAGLLKTDPADRGVRVEWQDPLPDDLGERLRAAEAKSRLGLAPDQVLGELGYGNADAGLT